MYVNVHNQLERKPMSEGDINQPIEQPGKIGKITKQTYSRM